MLLCCVIYSCGLPRPLPPRSLSLQVHWLRIILDEGHTLGASLAPTNKFSCACELTAERRWVTTGECNPPNQQ
jgi:hypothetical protein